MEQQMALNWADGFVPNQESLRLDHMTVNPAELSKIVRPDFNMDDDMFSGVHDSLKYLPDLSRLQSEFPLSTLADPNSEMQGQDIDTISMPPFDANLNHSQISGPFGDASQYALDYEETARQAPPHVQQGYEAPMYDMGFGSHYGPQSFNKGYMQLGSSMSISMTNNLPSNQVSFSSEPSNFASHGTIDSQTKELTPAAETPKASRAVAYLRRKEKTRYRRSVSRATHSPLPSSSPRENSMSHRGTSNSSISEESQSSHHIDAQQELNMLDKTFKPTSTFAQRKKAHLMKELEDKLAETLRQLKELMIDDEKFGGSSDVESNHPLTSTVPSSKVSASASEILESDASADNTSVSSTPRQPENIPASVEDKPPPCRHKPCQKCPFSTLYHCTYKGCGYATHQFADFVRHEGGDGHWPQNRFMCLECCPGSTNSAQEAPKDENDNSICVFCLLPFSLLPGTATQHFLECTAARNDATTFGRVDHLIEHRRDIHGIAGANKFEQKEVNKTTTSWKYPIESEWPRQCGTCGVKFTTWDERMKHLAEHFQEEFRKKSKRPFSPPKDFTPGAGPSRKDDDDDDDTPNGGNGGPRRYAPGQQGQSQTVAAQNSSSKSSQGQRSQGRHHNQTRDVYARNLYGQTALHLASSSSLALQRYLNDSDEPFTRWSLGLAPKYDNKSRVKDLLALIRERQQHLTNMDRQKESPSEDDESELRSATKQELVPGLVFKENVGALHVSPGHKYNVYLEAAAFLRGARFIPSLNTIPMNIVHWWEEATPPSVRKTISEGSIRDEPDISDGSKLGPRSPFPALAQDLNNYNDEFCVHKARVGTTDTVSIHGLNRNLYSSWQERKASSLNWPLGHSKARDIALMKCFDAIIKEPNEPLVSHQNMRTGDVEGYPIIFITHSLGGIVVKQALGLLQEAHVKTVSNFFLPRCSPSMDIPSYCRSKALVAELDEIVQSHLARDIHDKDRYSRLLEQVAPVSGYLTVLSALGQHMNNVQRDQNPGNIFELEVVNILPAYGILQIADFGIGKFHNLHSGTGTEPARGTPPCTAPRNKILSVYLDGSRHVGREPSKLSTSYNHSPLSTGSPAYQAPELFYDIGHAERLPAVDVWSLGAILSEAATWNNHHQTLLGKSKWEKLNSEILQGPYLEAVDLQCMHSSGTNNNYCPILRWHQTCFENPRVQHLTKHICEELEIALRADNHHEQADSLKRKVNWILHVNERHRHLMDAMVSPESCQESHPSAAISESWDEVDLEVNFHPTQCLLSDCRRGYIFKTLQSYRSHLKNVHDKGIYCRVLGCCDTKPFASRNDVDRHYRAKYDLDAAKSFRSERPSCVARVRSWKRKDKLREHDRKYHMEIPCHIRSHYFDNDQKLFEHTNLDHAIYDQRLDKFGRAISTVSSASSCRMSMYASDKPIIHSRDSSLSFAARKPGASYHSASELPPISPLHQIPRGPDSISAPKKGRDPESQRFVVVLDYGTTFTRVTYSVVVIPLKLATFYESHRETSEDHPPDKSELLHVVGMAGRFPEAASREKLWELLEKGLDVHRVAPKDRFNAETHYDSTGKIKNTSHTPYGYWIDNPGLFDPRFFNMSPRETSQTDPMQRMALCTAYETLEMASPTRIRPTKLDHIGNFFGQTSDDWREINRAQEVDTYFITGGVRAFGLGLNYHFEFSTPSFNIDTAGSSNQLGHQINLPLLSVKEAQKLLLLELDKREPPSRDDTNYFMDLVQSMGFLPVVTHAVAQRMKARDDPFSNFAKGYTCKARLGGLGMYTTVVDQPKSLSNLRSTDCQNHGDVEDQAVHETLLE